MGNKYLDLECDMVLTQQMLSGKWRLKIIYAICDKTLRFGEIRNRVGDIQEGYLSKILKELEEEKIITKKIYSVIPPKTEYKLTEFGLSLKDVMEVMETWGGSYRAFMNNQTNE